MQIMFRKIICALCFSSFFLTVSVRADDERPIVVPEQLVAKYGKPDRTESSEYENPRPPLVTRILTYKKSNVKIVLLAGGKVGAPPPYKQWHLMGFIDSKTNERISGEEANRRLLTAKTK